MNRHSHRTRVFALIAALVFQATMWSDAFGAHRCPHHDLLAGTAESVGHAASGHMHAGIESSQSPAHSHAPHGPCTCIGHCNAGGTAAVTSRPARVVIVIGTLVRSRAPEARTVSLGRTPFLHPFANAPPVLIAA
jgi:hypothetical protein